MIETNKLESVLTPSQLAFKKISTVIDRFENQHTNAQVQIFHQVDQIVKDRSNYSDAEDHDFETLFNWYELMKSMAIDKLGELNHHSVWVLETIVRPVWMDNTDDIIPFCMSLEGLPFIYFNEDAKNELEALFTLSDTLNKHVTNLSDTLQDLDGPFPKRYTIDHLKRSTKGITPENWYQVLSIDQMEKLKAS